jgi:putative ABC transport system substrate-binding protein
VSPARVVVVLAVLLVGALGAAAQQPVRPVRLGYLAAGSFATDSMRPALLEGLREHAPLEGPGLVVESRYAEGRFEQLPALAAELVRLPCDVIVASVTQASVAARDATGTIPIVMIGVADPVAAGLVAGLARPGGNVTGTSGAATQVVGKQLELFRETFPEATRVALLWNPANPVYQALQLREAQIAARTLRVELELLEARTPAEVARVFATIAPRRPLLLMGDPVFTAYRQQVAELATARRVPIVTGTSEYAQAGALITYGPSYPALARRSAVYVDKILKGARPAELPVEEPTTFELVVNLKAARTLGVAVPRSLLARADRVIE